MSKSIHQIEVRGRDATGGAFSSIKNRAAATGAQIRKLVGGAIAGAGAYLGMRAIAGTVNELGRLSDISMKTGVSVSELTKMTTAFSVAGLDISVDTLAKSFQYLQKNTGKQGSEAFFETVEAIGKIEDPAKRGAEMVKNFGRSGMELAPLINGGEDVVRKFKSLKDIMPGVSDSAANAGDDFADAMTMLGKGAQSLWMKVVGKICSLWSDQFPGGVRAGALYAIKYIEYFCKLSFNRLTKWGAQAGLAMQAVWNWAANDYSWEDAWKEFEAQNDYLTRDMDQQLAKIDQEKDDYIAKLRNTKVDDLANSFSKLGKGNGRPDDNEKANGIPAENETEKSYHSTRISNDLIMGGSNAALRAQILGPTLQSEAKKQTALLEKIADSSEKTADAVEEREHWQDVMKEIK